MYERTTITPLLESLIQDNPTFKFPFYSISQELLQMFLNKDEFDYFCIQCYNKLKREYGSTIAHIFLTTLNMKLDDKTNSIHLISIEEYSELIEELISTFENLYITKVEKKSPDGELMSALP
jgi:hypothetical protein